MTAPQDDSFDLAAAAREVMLERGFAPDLPADAARELAHLVPQPPGRDVRDLRGQLFSSIDNDESRDLDQIEIAERLDARHTRVLVGIADVDALVQKGSALDRHALWNTTSVYTGVVVFPMLPELLSTDKTSLNQDADRLAMIIEMIVDDDGAVERADVYRALVRNHAKLAYESVGAWLEGAADPPPPIRGNDALQRQLRLQDEVAQKLRQRRHEHGALELETIEARPVTRDGHVTDLAVTHKNRARELVEDLMIAANGSVARFLEAKRFSSIRRVVKAPERWKRLVALAAEYGETLPDAPSSIALAAFLSRRRAADPLRFADLSLAVVKLMGPGEYALERAGEPHDGHFGLAVQDYTHSTAPNRRYADLVTQRQAKAAIAGAAPPYTDGELADVAHRCTEKEDDARRVERQTRKQAAALLLGAHIGERFDAIVTGVTPHGTFVRLLAPPAEGRVIRGEEGLDVGDRVRVVLESTSPARGFIDFSRAR